MRDIQYKLSDSDNWIDAGDNSYSLIEAAMEINDDLNTLYDVQAALDAGTVSLGNDSEMRYYDKAATNNSDQYDTIIVQSQAADNYGYENGEY